MASRAEAESTGSSGSGDKREDDKLEPVFKDLKADDASVAPTEIESLCVNCGQNVSLCFAELGTWKAPQERVSISNHLACGEKQKKVHRIES